MVELQVDSVICRYGDRAILSNIFLYCKQGEITGLLGRNGCGKSTLLKIIFGTLQPQSQCIRIDGTYYEKPYLHKNQVAYLPQHNFIPRHISVKKAINLFVNNRKKRETILNDQRIQQHLKKKIRQLSGGERRYLEVHLIMGQDTRFVLLDEPFSGIEPLYREYIRYLIRNCPDHKGVIVTDHDYHNILTVSHHIVLLKGGKTIPIQNLDELRKFHYLPEDI